MSEALVSQAIVVLVVAGAALLVGFALLAIYVMIGEPK